MQGHNLKVFTLHKLTILFLFFVHPFFLNEYLASVDSNKALFQAVMSNDVKEANKLLSHGADPNQTIEKAYKSEHFRYEHEIPLNIAIQKNNFNMVKLLIQFGAKVNLTDPIVLTHDHLKTIPPLIMAVEISNTRIVQYLLKKGAYVNSKIPNESEWDSPLTLAIVKKSLSIVKMLVKFGAHINAKHMYFESGIRITPISIAVYHRCYKIANYLFQHGLRVEQHDQIILISLSLNSLDEKTMDFLLLFKKMNFNFNAIIPEIDLTPLMYFTGKCSKTLEAPKIADRIFSFENEDIAYDPKTLYNICVKNIRFLLKSGANINERTQVKGRTALFYATNWYHDAETKQPRKAPDNTDLRNQLIQNKSFSFYTFQIIMVLLENGARF